jgi:hypothetical protein
VLNGFRMPVGFAKQNRQGHVGKYVGIVGLQHFLKSGDGFWILAGPLQVLGSFE